MKHPPSKTVGRRYWLAKCWPKTNDFAPAPEIQIANGTYSLSLSNFDPREMTLKEAIKAGRETSLDAKFGVRFGSQIYHLAKTARIGDIVFLETSSRNLHAWGEVTSGYTYTSSLKNIRKAGLHAIGVSWHKVEGAENSFKTFRADNLFFRDITGREELIQSLEALTKDIGPAKHSEEAGNIPPDLEFSEGKPVLKAHLSAERNSQVVQLAKKQALERAKPNHVSCETCHCVPKNKYDGMDLIEAHHRIPLAHGVRDTKPGDFAMLCPCCHRAVHKLINKGVDPIAALKRISKLFA
jgi:hypothetical protein